MKLLLLFVCCSLFSQKIIISDELTWYDGSLKGVINYSSIMVGEKVFVGVESGTWKDLDGILAAETNINENLSIYSGIRFKKQIRGYFMNVNYNTDRCLCRKQWPIKYYVGVKSLSLKDVRLSVGIRYGIKI
tara:strand:- start:66 stop:461 length:396 start_codon:yes stop_codon:yes gene_type:complete